MTTSTTGPPPGRSAGRFIAVVAGTILGLLAVTSVALGGALVGMHSTKRDADGFYATGQKTLATPTHALVADKLDAGTDGPGWLFRKSRLGTDPRRGERARRRSRSSSASPARPQVDAYLRGVAQDEITDLEVDPLSVTYDRRPGTATPGAPGAQQFWASQRQRQRSPDRDLAGAEGQLGRRGHERRRHVRRPGAGQRRRRRRASSSGSAPACWASARSSPPAPSRATSAGARRSRRSRRQPTAGPAQLVTP